MSYTNGFQTLVQSMNGLLTFNDGAGTVIENGTISTQSLSLNNILATLPTLVVNLWTNITNANAYLMTNLTNGSIFLGTALSTGSAGVLYLGNELCTIVLGSFFMTTNSIQAGITGIITVDLFTTMTTSSILNIGNSIINMSVGAFSFIGKSIQSGTSGTFNFFTEVTGSSTVNFFSNMPSGTLNIGKGGNINIGQATTGSLIKIDQNGLDNQVLISTQQSGTGVVTIGNQGVTKLLGTTTTVGGTTVNVGNQNAGINNTTLNLGTIGLTSGANYVNMGNQNTATSIKGPIGFFCSTTSGGYFYPSYMGLQSGGDSVIMNFRGASNTLNNTCETRILSYSGPGYTANNQGLLQTFSGQVEFIVGSGGSALNNPSPSIAPRGIPGYAGVGITYYAGGGTAYNNQNATTLTSYGAFGGLRIMGAGDYNPIAPSTPVQCMTTYPYYGTRFFNGGISIDKGSLTENTRGNFYQQGAQGFTTSVPANPGTPIQVTVSYPIAFTTTPIASVIVISSSTNNATNALLATVYDYQPGLFRCWVKNVSGTSTFSNPWAIYWNAWGGY